MLTNRREANPTVRNRFHSQVVVNAAICLGEWWRTRPRPRGAIVCGEAGFRLKGSADSLVGIDVAVASAELVASTDPEEKIYSGPPILAIEVLSPSDTHDDIVDRRNPNTRSKRRTDRVIPTSRPWRSIGPAVTIETRTIETRSRWRPYSQEIRVEGRPPRFFGTD